MTASASRAPARVYVSQVTMYPVTPGDPKTDYVIVSVPHPIHHARIVHHWGTGRYTVSMTSTTIPRALTLTSLDDATATGSDWVSRLAGRDLNRFTGAQRTMLGQQRCPARRGDLLCGEPAGVGTVWCEGHPDDSRLVVPRG